jgi:hypothetical protein
MRKQFKLTEHMAGIIVALSEENTVSLRKPSYFIRSALLGLVDRGMVQYVVVRERGKLLGTEVELTSLGKTCVRFAGEVLEAHALGLR